MIRVKMELDTHGIGVKVRTLCTLEIVNDGKSSTTTRGHYDWKLLGRKGQLIRQGRLENWPRHQKSPGQLLQAVLNKAYESPKGEPFLTDEGWVSG